MSWVFGALGKNGNRVDSEYLKSLHTKPLYNISTESIYIAAGGNKYTCFYGDLNLDWNWIVCGIGLDIKNGTTRVFSSIEWSKVFSNDTLRTRNINGHFAAIKWSKNVISLYTDILGLRDFYLAQTEKFIYFSTRIDLIAKVESADIDLNTFGSRWLLFNQLSDDSILTNILRVNHGKSVLIKNGNFRINQPEQFLVQNSVQTDSESTFDSTMRSLINVDSTNNKYIFALSGGLDSRLILSYLLKYQSGNFKTITFGNKTQADAIVAQKMADEIGFEHEIIYSDLPSIDKLVSDIEDAVISWQVTNPVSAILNLRDYLQFEESELIIDGGFGEIWRSEFLKRLKFYSKKHIIRKNYEQIINFLRYNHADIFSVEANESMEKGAVNDLEKLISISPDHEVIGFDNWIDTIALNIRLPNFYGPEQNRIDNFVISFMPFVQPELLKNLYMLNINLRKNGILLGRMIKNNYPQLAEFPLVKGELTYPFFLSTFQTRVWCKLKSFYSTDTRKKDVILLLNKMKDYVMDIINSESVKHYQHYDYVKVRKLAEKFYSGNHKSVNQLDWFLSFEIFRRNISRN